MGANRPFDLLVFDWDGTLADSEALIVSHMQAAIRELDLPPRDDAQIGQLIGLGFAEGMALLYPELDNDGLLQRLMNYRSQFMARAGVPREAPLFAGALGALRNLADQGYLMAVATGKSRSGFRRSLRHHPEVGRLIHTSRTADETANKPEPLMLREILEELDVPVTRALMIGDTEYDAQMAAALGMAMLGLSCGVHDSGRILAAGAAAVLASVRDLPGWLATCGGGESQGTG